jgi:hypothetical protein
VNDGVLQLLHRVVPTTSIAVAIVAIAPFAATRSAVRVVDDARDVGVGPAVDAGDRQDSGWLVHGNQVLVDVNDEGFQELRLGLGVAVEAVDAREEGPSGLVRVLDLPKVPLVLEDGLRNSFIFQIVTIAIVGISAVAGFAIAGVLLSGHLLPLLLLLFFPPERNRDEPLLFTLCPTLLVFFSFFGRFHLPYERYPVRRSRG